MQPLTEQQVRDIVRSELQEFLASDRYIFHKTIQILDGRNIQVGNATGTKIGNMHLNQTDKIGFLGKTARVAYTPGGVATASGTWGNTEQNMLQNAYDCLRAFGLLS